MSLAFVSFAFDAPEYNPGQAINLTVNYTSSDLASAASVASAVTVTLTDAASGAVTQASDTSGNFPDLTVTAPSAGAQPTSVSASDSRATPGTWTLVSNTISGDAAPFTGVAVLSSTA